MYGLKPVSLNVLLFFKKKLSPKINLIDLYTVIKTHSMYFTEKSKL